MYMHGPQEDSKEVAALSEQNEEVEMPTLAEGSEVPRYSRDAAEMQPRYGRDQARDGGSLARLAGAQRTFLIWQVLTLGRQTSISDVQSKTKDAMGAAAQARVHGRAHARAGPHPAARRDLAEISPRFRRDVAGI